MSDNRRCRVAIAPEKESSAEGAPAKSYGKLYEVGAGPRAPGSSARTRESNARGHV
jgi:hypothetical protein